MSPSAAGCSRSPSPRRGRRPTRWSRFLLLLLALTIAVGPGSPTQLVAQEARVMADEEREALHGWALDRLGELDAGEGDLASALPHSLDTERLWALYFLAVEEREWEKPAVSLADSLADLELPEAVQIRALGAALEVVRAKNSRWPPNKLKHLRIGISALNELVEAEPDDPVVRYLRLMSCYYLPFFLDQDELVEEDMNALAILLPEAGNAFSPYVFRGVARFVLDNGSFDEPVKARISASLASAGGSQ